MAGRDDAPWLAPADPGDAPAPGSLPSRLPRAIAALVALALIAITLVWVLTSRSDGTGEGYMEAAQAPLITAEPGPFKVKPDDPRGLAVEGQDQTIYEAGAGIDAPSEINLAAGPEEPLPRPGTGQDLNRPGTGQDPQQPGTAPPRELLPPAMRTADPTRTAAAPPAAAPPATTTASRPATPAAVPPAPTAAPARPAATPRAPTAAPIASRTTARTAQLGAFSTRKRAEEVWAALSKRHGMLSFTPSYAAVERNGQTLWRLRATGGDAAELCQRLAATGDTCTLVTS